MLKRIISPAAIALMLSTPVWAQGAQPAEDPAAAPQQQGAGQQLEVGAAADDMEQLQAQLPQNAIPSDDIVGRSAVNPQGENLGNIDSLIIDRDNGQITHAVVSVGGFLGMGDRKVALNWDSLEITPEQVTVNATREQLEQAEAYVDPDQAGQQGSAPQDAEQQPAPGGTAQ
ncbi:PRC-barrel domain-containing protein [Telmatospirillum sp. J64-1]|uniref:PRC-barrel domain-containing protein n=1 Tax=Telmatospirillum sp. J64-1 TaxID=2502183 RepID=UPI00115E742A|nr:PRC-barrel domain-containing protein [Telmatospirillum sp. J64-1]